MYHKWQSHDVWFLRYKCDKQNFLSFWANFFALFTLSTTRKIKILKKWKKSWIYYSFTQVYRKWWSYDVWFLRYGVRQTEFFIILGHFLPFYPLIDPEYKNFEKCKNIWKYYYFTHDYLKWQSYDDWTHMLCDGQKFLTLWTILWPFIPLTTQKTQIL